MYLLGRLAAVAAPLAYEAGGPLMLFLAIGLIYAGYGVSSYGYALVKGYDITLREWFSPLHPYQWPAKGGKVPTVPQGQVWPSGSQSVARQPGPQQTLGRGGAGR